MPRLSHLRSLTFDLPGFWEVVDSLTNAQMEILVERVGGWDLLTKKYNTKRGNCNARGLKLRLSLTDYACLVYAARITLSSIGRHSAEVYELARLGDRGDYRRRKCRFITRTENVREIVRSAESLSAASRRAADTRRDNQDQNPDYYADSRISAAEKFKKSSYVRRLKHPASNRRSEFEESCQRPDYLNEGNSQWGTFWVTNGRSNLKWSPLKGKIPNGFRRGRTRLNW
jgi:hypothetical protein